MSFPAINTPETNQSQPKPAKPNKKALAIVGGSFLAFGGIVAALALGGGSDSETDKAKADEPDGDSKRAVADKEKNKVMAEMGRKGAQKRWAKEKAKKEKEKEKDDPEDT